MRGVKQGEMTINKKASSLGGGPSFFRMPADAGGDMHAYPCSFECARCLKFSPKNLPHFIVFK